MSQLSHISTKIRLHDFSSARRIFALSQVKQVAADLEDQSLVSQIHRAISFDHETMHLEALWKNAVEQYHTFVDDPGMMERLFELQRREIDDRQQKGQQLLIQVVATILSDGIGINFHDMEARRALLAPIYEHNLRLHLRRDRETDVSSDYCETASHA